jgi:aminoglycoside phosphotransferase family enzyme/predicted kinase
MDRLARFLEQPSSYPHKPATVRSTQTHISWVFFASPFVFKIKKPVNFGFLNFSSLEQRRYYCEREMELNRRLAPDVYCGVVPIYENGDTFSFEANGEVAEYSVQMKELPDGSFLHQLLRRGLVSEPEVNRVISRLHEFYDSVPPIARTEEWGTPEKLKITTDENLALAERFAGKTITPCGFEVIRFFTTNFFTHHAGLLNKRVEQGWVRDCHGDLRLEHIHLTPDIITIFDCIEFNDRLRFIDIANDLAFLAMDFDFEGRSDLGNFLLENASQKLRDPDLPKLTDFYKCYRAAVRGKVESLEVESCAPDEAAEHVKRAERYYRLALRYAIAGSRRMVLVVMGPIATGKSAVAQQVAAELGWPVYSSDRIRKTLANLPLTKRTETKERERVYSEEMNRATYEKLFSEGLAALEKNDGIVLDATFSKRAYRDLLRDAFAKPNVALQIIELKASEEVVKRHLKTREQSEGEISDARLEDFEKLTAAYESPSEMADDLIRISADAPVSETVSAVLGELAERQSR